MKARQGCPWSEGSTLVCQGYGSSNPAQATHVHPWQAVHAADPGARPVPHTSAGRWVPSPKPLGVLLGPGRTCDLAWDAPVPLNRTSKPLALWQSPRF